MKSCKRCGNTTRFKPDGECVPCANKRRNEWRAQRRSAVILKEEDRAPMVIPKNPRILTIDIETAPLKVWAWGIWEQNISLDMIAEEWSILYYSAKWLGSRERLFGYTGGRGVDKVRDDKPLVEEIWKLLDQADLVVGQNAVRFDIKKINARLIMHGYLPYSPVRTIDTLLVAKKYFAFTSNKLEWQSRYLTDSPKSKHKKFPGFEMWDECLKDNPAAWKEMRKYNERDVLATEKLYLKHRPWITNHPNIGTFNTRGDVQCPKCSSFKLIEQGFHPLQLGMYPRYQCLSCGGWARGKKMVTDKEARAVKLV